MLTLGIVFGISTLLVMFSGLSIAYSLGVVATIFMILYMPASSLDTIAQNVYEEMSSLTLLSLIPFIMQGAIIGKSPAGRDLYRGIHAWFYRIPGGIGVANIVACGLFAAMSGSSPATASAIGSAGIPEMRSRGYSGGFAAGLIAAGGTLGILIPPSITLLLYAVASEQSIGRLFMAGIGPGILLVAMFSIYTIFQARKEYALAKDTYAKGGAKSAYLHDETYTFRQKVEMLPRVLPFILILTGVMIALYGGYATPTEAAGIAAFLSMILIMIIYRIWRPTEWVHIMSSVIKESTMLLLIVGMSLFFSYVMSYLHISQSAAQWIVGLHLTKWVLLSAIIIFLLILGFFLPPVSIILMTAPIILYPLKDAGFDLIWFGVILTIIMEMGLIHPPVGLNIFVIKNIAPDIPLNEIMWGVVPFVILMTIAIILLCFFPSIATKIPNLVMGST